MPIDRNLALVACSLEQDDLRARAERWRALRTAAGLETASTARGLRLTFRGDPGVAEELEALAALEQECCAFADWTVATDNGHVVLEVAGASEEAIRAVHAMFA